MTYFFFNLSKNRLLITFFVTFFFLTKKRNYLLYNFYVKKKEIFKTKS